MNISHACIPVFAAALFIATSRGAPPAPVVKLSAPLKIDGKVEDWPFPPTLNFASQKGRAELRLGYDDRCFYLAAAVADDNPWKNNASRREEAIKGGDAVAVYFQTSDGDQQRILITPGDAGVNVIAFREHSLRKKPYTFASPVGQITFDEVEPLEGAKAAVVTNSSGYVLEVALPWKSLGVSPSVQQFKFDAQVIFSDPAGTTNVDAAWWHASEGPGLTIEDFPTEARLYPDTWGSAALTDKAAADIAKAPMPPGRVAASENLIRLELPRSAKVSILITDQDGWILRELVTAKALEKGVHEIPWDGRDRYREPLPPGMYSWKALAFDGMGMKFMGSVGNSGRPPYRTPDGLGSLGGQHGSSKALAADEGGIYMAGALQEGPPAMRKIDSKTGKALWKRAAGGFQAITAAAAGEGMACVINTGGKKPNCTSDLIRINPQTGKDEPMGSAKPTRTLEVPAESGAIGGLAIAGGRAWFSVTSENRVGSIDLRTGEAGPTYPLPSPAGLARLDGDHLLACSGNDVVSIDLLQGQKKPVLKLTAPRAVAVGPDGKIYVSELGESQQIKVFAANGKPLAEWGRKGGKPLWMPQYDPLAFKNVICVAAGPDGNIWLAEDFQTPNRFVKLSPKGEWLEDFYGPVAYNTLGPDLDDFSTVFYTPGGRNHPDLIETKIDYDKYQADPENPAAAWSIRAIFDLGLAADGVGRNDVMSQVAALGYGHVIAFKATNGNRYLFRFSKQNRASSPVGAGLWIWRQDRWLPCALISGDKDQASWTDANADGLIQPEETYATEPLQSYAWIGPDLRLDGNKGKLGAASVNANGVPDYKGGKYDPYLGPGGDPSVGGASSFPSREADGAVYYVSNIGPHRHLSFWDRATENRLTKVADHRVQWFVGEHTPKPVDTEFSTASGVAGVVDDIVLTHNIEPANYPAFTSDGFALGNAMVDKTGERPSVGPEVISIENFTGLFVKDPKTGKRVLFAVSSGDDRILEVTGPGKTDRLHGTVELKRVAAKGDRIVIPYSTWYGNVGRGLGIDGEDTEWQPDVPAFSLIRDGQIVGDVRLRRDAGSLHLFVSALEQGASAGIRFVLARQPDGGNFVTVDLTAVKGEAGNWTAKAALSRSGQEMPTAGVKVAAADRWLDLGCRIEAEIPLDLLEEYSLPVEQTFRRVVKNAEPKSEDLKSITENRLDLTGPLFMSIELQGGKAGASTGGLSLVDLPAPAPSPKKK